jgi:hypothetical protein
MNFCCLQASRKGPEGATAPRAFYQHGCVSVVFLFPFLSALFVKISYSLPSISNSLQLADLTVKKRPGTSSRIEIHFALFNH